MANAELDSFYVKFKNLLYSEKDATLTLKSEAGRALVTLSLDLGHVHSEHEHPRHGGHRNGPARQRRRDKRAADRLEKDNQATEKVKLGDAVEASKVFNPTEKVSADADEAKKFERAATAPLKTKAISEKEIAVMVEVHNAQESDAAKAEGPLLKEVEDMFRPNDELDRTESKETRSVETQTLESGIAQPSTSTFGKEFYTLTYDDFSDED